MGARLNAFDRHKNNLLTLLQTTCERSPKTKSFDSKRAWRVLKFMARVYLSQEEDVDRKPMLIPDADRKQLRQLRTALGNARCKLAEVVQKDLRGQLFLAWGEAHGDPDLLDPVIVHVEARFNEVVRGVLDGLADFEAAAGAAAAGLHQKPGRPEGTGVLPHDLIISLESSYRNITGKRGGAGPGPFTRFVTMFLEALGRDSVRHTVIEAVKEARRHDSRWGQSFFAGMGGKPPAPIP
jgi:hypothetical protein